MSAPRGYTPRMTTTHTAEAAAEIREFLTAALHGGDLPPAVLAHLPAELRQVATPAACHLLTGRKSVIEAVVAAVIERHHAEHCAELRAMCRGD